MGTSVLVCSLFEGSATQRSLIVAATSLEFIQVELHMKPGCFATRSKYFFVRIEWKWWQEAIISQC